MTARTGTDTIELARRMGALTEGMVGAQDMALRLLKAEMEALASLLPGLTAADEATRAANETAHEAEVEAAFDNMPL